MRLLALAAAAACLGLCAPALAQEDDRIIPEGVSAGGVRAGAGADAPAGLGVAAARELRG